ncbi:MAG: hypothetical protein M1834_006915 [Cirrosporium novae-zelandiae]|nr:MAG: hypothetical protein M1834_006915 [Cirrosporium novae-zelandiae]
MKVSDLPGVQIRVYVDECSKTVEEIKDILEKFEQKSGRESRQPSVSSGAVPSQENNQPNDGTPKRPKNNILAHLSTTHLKWPLQKSETLELINRLERLKNTCTLALLTDTMNANVKDWADQISAAGIPWMYWQVIPNDDPHDGWDYEVGITEHSYWPTMKSVMKGTSGYTGAFDYSAYLL